VGSRFLYSSNVIHRPTLRYPTQRTLQESNCANAIIGRQADISLSAFEYIQTLDLDRVATP